ncbi:class I SAM-dependent methyltransferase [Candidatus Magnetobacterium casense]|uniref:Phospholipid N-methyltransferase n=1 Tax=Candidatus Magnetobacterium casense TaxID=1455061 RepID=A0ABS6S322_9BACT|nr:rRNA adenine N-6-methyltransferase family protein [Candidatus Magnetobacterium casensis]MBV6343244.1 hypothetical protein [Candidatus Magnetobacterium casensis]
MTSLTDRLYFLVEAVRDFRTTGSVTPSSRFLVDRMLSPIDFSKAGLIVELGSGTGCLTRELLKRMRGDAELFCFEVNKVLCATLYDVRDNRIEIINDRAERLPDRLCGRKADYIVSGLPLASLPRDVGMQILDAVEGSLSAEGAYIQFQYSLVSYKALKERFQVEKSFVLLNLPPAFVYVCRLGNGSSATPALQ